MQVGNALQPLESEFLEHQGPEPLEGPGHRCLGLHQVPLGVLGTSPETEPLPQAPRGPLSTPDGTNHRQEKTWPGHLSP